MKVYTVEKSVWKNNERCYFIAKVLNSKENAESYVEYRKKFIDKKNELINYYIEEVKVDELDYKSVIEICKLLSK